MSVPCRHLRWKGRQGKRFARLRDLVQNLRGNAVPFTCLRTTHPWGPDDEPAAPELCTPSRTCFERRRDAT